MEYLAKARDNQQRDMITFLQRNQAFKNLPRRKVSSYTQHMEMLTLTRGQIVYRQGTPATFVYFVFNGAFELSTRLPRSNGPIRKGNDRPFERGKPEDSTNCLERRMPEMSDFPYSYRISLLEVGSMAGDEDILARATYSC